MVELDRKWQEWRTSSRSGENGSCVEVRAPLDEVQVRDTKQNGLGPILGFPKADWAQFTQAIAGGNLGA